MYYGGGCSSAASKAALQRYALSICWWKVFLLQHTRYFIRDADLLASPSDHEREAWYDLVVCWFSYQLSLFVFGLCWGLGFWFVLMVWLGMTVRSSVTQLNATLKQWWVWNVNIPDCKTAQLRSNGSCSVCPKHKKANSVQERRCLKRSRSMS